MGERLRGSVCVYEVGELRGRVYEAGDKGVKHGRDSFASSEEEEDGRETHRGSLRQF